MPYTGDQLAAIARRYWRNDKIYDSGTAPSPEYLELCLRWQEVNEHVDEWYDFARKLRTVLPHLKIGNHAAACDAAWKYLAYEQFRSGSSEFRFVVVGCVSLLAPVYTLYGVEYDFGEPSHTGRKLLNPRLSLIPLPPAMREIGAAMGREIEAYFGAELISRELLETPVSLIVNFKEPPHTTLLHALFTEQPENLP